MRRFLPLFDTPCPGKFLLKIPRHLGLSPINPSHRIENSFPFRLGCCQKKQADWMAKGQFSPSDAEITIDAVHRSGSLSANAVTLI
jgi:hypothetical protein